MLWGAGVGGVLRLVGLGGCGGRSGGLEYVDGERGEVGFVMGDPWRSAVVQGRKGRLRSD